MLRYIIYIPLSHSEELPLVNWKKLAKDFHLRIVREYPTFVIVCAKAKWITQFELKHPELLVTNPKTFHKII